MHITELKNCKIYKTNVRINGVFRDEANFLCHYGYHRYGVESVICQASGKWSDDPPICDGIFIIDTLRTILFHKRNIPLLKFLF